MAKYDIQKLKAAARGRWIEIFRTLAGVEIDPNPSHHGPCPKCGGTDRFRCIDAEEGVLICSQCFSAKNGDGLSALQWLTGQSFGDTCKSLALFLGLDGCKPYKGKGGKPKAKVEPPPKRFVTKQAVVRYFVEQLSKNHGAGVRCVKSWSYGTFHVLRFDLPTPAGEKQRKEFRPVHQIKLGDILGWQIGYPDGPRPLYHLDQVVAAPAGLVTVHGGEKATDAAAALELLATTNAGGEQAIDKTDWSPITRFAVVAIVIDNDEAGEKFGKALAARLHKLKADLDVRIIRLPGLPPKGDVVEWIAAGGDREKFIGLVEAAEPTTEAEASLSPTEADDNPRRLAIVCLKKHEEENTAIRYWRDEWCHWKKRYSKVSDQEMRGWSAEFIHHEYLKIAQQKQKAENEKDKPSQIEIQKVTSGTIGNMLTHLAGMVTIPADIEPGTWLPTRERRNYISLQNGLLDVDGLLAGRDNCLMPNTPDWFSPVCLPYDFDPKAKCPKWEAFLEYCLEMDPERIKFIQEWAGYLLLPETGEQTFVILEGEGSNGKSVCLAGLTALLGRQNVSAVPFEIFGERFALVDTIGKLMNCAADCGDLDKSAEGHLKWFTGGNEMRFDRKGLPAITCTPTARLMLACNNRPRINDRSQGVWRRMKIMPWKVEVPKDMQVHGMDKVEWWEASGELPGILCWAIRGKVRLLAQGKFSRSEIMEAAKEEYRTETNPARAFLIACCEENLGYCTSRKELYEAYAKWCKENGHNHPLASNQFGKEVKRYFKKVEEGRASGEGRERLYRGVRLKADIE